MNADQRQVRLADAEAIRLQGEQLYLAGAVRHWEQNALDDLLTLSAEVHEAGAVYRVYVAVDAGTVHGECTCELGADCAHVAAVLARRAGPLEHSASQPPAAARSNVLEQRHQLVYVLGLKRDASRLLVAPMRVRTGAASAGTPVLYSLDRLREARQPAYVQDADIELLQQLARHVDDATVPAEQGSDAVTDAGQAAPGMAAAYELTPPALAVLDALIASGRCYWGSPAGPKVTRGRELPASLAWRLCADGSQVLEQSAPLPPGSLRLPVLPPCALDTGRAEVSFFALGEDAAQICALMAAGPLSAESSAAMRQDLGAASESGLLPLPRPMHLTAARGGAALARLELFNIGGDQGDAALPVASLRFRYQDLDVDWNDPRQRGCVGDDQVAPLRRDPDAEQRCLQHLLHRGLQVRADGLLSCASDSASSEAIWARLQHEAAMNPDSLPELRIRAGFRSRLLADAEWYGELQPQGSAEFLLDIGVDHQGQRFSLLAALLDWIRAQPPGLMGSILDGQQDDSAAYLPVPGRGWVRLGHQLLSGLLRVLLEASEHAPASGPLRLPRSRLSDLSDEPLQLHGDGELRELVQRLAQTRTASEVAVPDALKAQLREYQCAGLAWMQFLRRYGLAGILADDMGLGKTVQSLAHVLSEKQAGRLDAPALIVAPSSLMFNWRAEAARFAPDLSLCLLHGADREQRYPALADSDLVLTSYPILLRDIERLQGTRFHLLILDEAQVVKNAAAQISRAVRLVDARHRLCLTGTPLENHLGELWSLYDFLMPGFLGTRKGFQRLFRDPVEQHGDEHRRQALVQRIRPYFMRRCKHEVAPELPQRVEIAHGVEMHGAQRELYEQERERMLTRVREALHEQPAGRGQMVVLDALLRLRQICCDPRLLRDVDPSRAPSSAKLEALTEMLPELLAEGRRVLLFSQFVRMLDLIEPELQRLGLPWLRLTGKTRDRGGVVSQFQQHQAPLFLISLKAGGTGLNLTAADTVIHYDPWWNPAVEDQASSRAHRIGQEQTVFVYRLLTDDSVEQRIVDMQHSKRLLADGMLSGGGAHRMDPDELLSFFQALA